MRHSRLLFKHRGDRRNALVSSPPQMRISPASPITDDSRKMAEPPDPKYPLPLRGVRVLDVSQIMAGPFCSMMLADMGADVIKIEPPDGGDQTRRAMGFKLKGDDSLGFFTLNLIKSSIHLKFKHQPAGTIY